MSKYINIPLSNVDLNTFIKKFDKKGVNIYQMKDIKPNTDIESIFSNRGHCILYVHYNGSNVGHWVTLLRNEKKQVAFIDSLGYGLDHYNKHAKQCFKNNGINELFENKKKFQGDTSICGRYGVVFCAYHKLHQNPQSIYKFMEEGKKKHGSYDKFILDLST